MTRTGSVSASRLAIRQCAGSVRVVSVGEVRLRPGGLVDEGQRVDRRFHPSGQAVDVLAALVLHLGERGALGLGLDHPDWLAVDEQQVVDTAVALFKNELPDGYTPSGTEVGLVGMLDDPPGRHELPVDVDTRLGLARKVLLGRVAHGQ